MSSAAISVRSGRGVTLPAIIPASPQKVAIGGSSVQSAAFKTGCTIIRIFPTVDCYISIGTNPTADSNAVFCPGGVIQYLGVSFSSTAIYKIAVIQSSSSGTLHIVEGQ